MLIANYTKMYKDQDHNDIDYFICEKEINKGCYFKDMKCDDVKKLETLIKLRVGDHYTTIIDKLYQMTIMLEDDMFDDDQHG